MKPIVRFALDVLDLNERIEHLERENARLRAENQELRAELNQLRLPTPKTLLLAKRVA